MSNCHLRQNGDADLRRAEIDRDDRGARVSRRTMCCSLPPASSATRSIRWPPRFSMRPRNAGLPLNEASEISERPGEGLRGMVDGTSVRITSRKARCGEQPELADSSPDLSGGLECVVLHRRALCGDLAVSGRAAGRRDFVHQSSAAPSTISEGDACFGRPRIRGALSGRSGGHQRRALRPKSGAEAGPGPPKKRAAPTRCFWATASTTRRR